MPLLCLAIAFWLWRPIRHENDIFWHLACGRWMVEHHAVAKVDVFSSTVLGHAWVNHEWLFEIGAFLFYKLGGFAGINLLKTGLIIAALIMASLIGLRSGIPPPIVCTGMALSFWASRYGWNERADLISIFFATMLMVGLWGWSQSTRKEGPSMGWLFFFASWANLHGGFILGLAVLYLFFLGLMAEQRRWMPLWAAWCMLATAATLCNPWGYHLHHSLLAGLSFLKPGFIREWMPTPWWPMQVFWACLVLHWLLFIQHVRQRDAVPWSLFFVHLLLAWSAVVHVRNVPYFMLLAFPFCLLWLNNWRPIPAGRLVHFSAALIFFILLFAYRSSRAMGSGIDPQWQPVDACEFIARTGVPGHFYNDYAFGGYWMWRFGTSRPVFIDGRLHMVTGYPELYELIRKAKAGSAAGWGNFLRSYKVDNALISSVSDPSVLSDYFPPNEWTLLYKDPVAEIFTRRGLSAVQRAPDRRASRALPQRKSSSLKPQH